MKRYHVITYPIGYNENVNEEALLPANCDNITGVFATISGKKEVALSDYDLVLPFPQTVIVSLLYDNLTSLFYTFMLSRSTKEIAKQYFIDEMLPQFVNYLKNGIVYDTLSEAQKTVVADNIQALLEGSDDYEGLADYLFETAKVFETDYAVSDLIYYLLDCTLQYIYDHRLTVFVVTSQHYEQSTDFDAGNLTLLINGNKFMLRDYVLTANRKLRSITKEVVPLNEPLESNSNLNIVFKNTLSEEQLTDDLTLKVYIEYEYERTTA